MFSIWFWFDLVFLEQLAVVSFVLGQGIRLTQKFWFPIPSSADIRKDIRLGGVFKARIWACRVLIRSF